MILDNRAFIYFIPLAFMASLLMVPSQAIVNNCPSLGLKTFLSQVSGPQSICDYSGLSSKTEIFSYDFDYANTTTGQDYAGYFEFKIESENGNSPVDYFDIISITDTYKQTMVNPVQTTVQVDLSAVKNTNSAILVRFVPSNPGAMDGTDEAKICDETEINPVSLNCNVTGYAKVKAETQGKVQITFKPKTSVKPGVFNFTKGLGKMIFVSNTPDKQVRTSRSLIVKGEFPNSEPTPNPTPTPTPTPSPTPSPTSPTSPTIVNKPLVRTGAPEVLLGLVYIISTLSMILIARISYQKRL
jgi:hypothetical protein